MAKVPFSKLKCKIDDSVKEVKLTDDIIIEVKQYLPIQEKLGLIGRVISYSHNEDANYSNPVKSDVLLKLELVYNYTNLSFTDKQKEDIPKLYDILYSSGILTKVIDNIPEEEIAILTTGTNKTIESIYSYQNSAYGILEGLVNKYNEQEFDVENIKGSLQELTNTPVIKELLPLLEQLG